MSCCVQSFAWKFVLYFGAIDLEFGILVAICRVNTSYLAFPSSKDGLSSVVPKAWCRVSIFTDIQVFNGAIDAFQLSVGTQNLPWSVSVSDIANGIKTLAEHGWPPSFILMYDEPWVSGRRALLKEHVAQ